MMRRRPVTSQELEIVTFLQSLSGMPAKNRTEAGRTSGMKKYIREMIDDLKHPKANKDFVPPVLKGGKENPLVELMPPPAAPVPDDLSNQMLSKNAEEKVKQLDYQAFESERLQTDS
jgi:hypothetical protein